MIMSETQPGTSQLTSNVTHNIDDGVNYYNDNDKNYSVTSVPKFLFSSTMKLFKQLLCIVKCNKLVLEFSPFDRCHMKR